jgi:putative SOS response-associated peptidase YedK
MCARFTLRRRLNLVMKELAEMLPVGLFDWDQPPRFNIAPTQQVAAVRATADAGQREVVPLKWGLIPSWSKDAKLATSCINARGETIATKPAFRSAFKKRRCLILADGYFEWTGKPGHKQPWHFRFDDDRAFAFAGLWEHWKPPEGDPVETCTIVTTEANAESAKFHDRMPVVLDPHDYSQWLDPATAPADLTPMIQSRSIEGLKVHAANPAVNNSRYTGDYALVAPS